jgi:outer membrane receptor protein involved in Fe transport
MKAVLPICIAAALALSAANASTRTDYNTRVRLDIESKMLRDALNDWAQQTGFQLIAPSLDVTTRIIVSDLKGLLSPREALERMLKDTPLTYEWVGERVVAIRERNPSTAQMRSLGSGGDAKFLRIPFVSMNENESESVTVERVAAVTPAAGGGAAEDGARDSTGLRHSNLEEIIVTAQKREQKLIEVPMSITAVSGEQLTEAGVDDMQTLSFAVPGMATQEIGPGRQNISIRGLGATKGSSSLVGIYLDETSLTGPQDGFVSTYIALPVLDLERVEVLKGPQGTLFGEGSVGGTVRFITKDPELDRVGGDVSASLYGTSDGGWSEEATGVINLPLVEDKFGLRLATAYANNAGWVDKVQTVNGPVIDEDFNDQELLDVRVKSLWTPMEDLRVTGMVSVHRGEGGGSNIVNVGRRDDSNFIIEFAPSTPTGFTDDYEIYNLTGTYDFGSVQLLSSTSYTDTSSTAAFAQRRPIIPTAAHPEGGFQEILIQDYALDSTAFSQELRLSSADSGSLKWSLGAFYKDAELIQNYVSGVDFYRFGTALVIGDERGLKPTTKSESRTVFGDATYALTSQLEVGGGVRYFEDDRESFSAGVPDVSSTFVSGSFNATTFRAYLSYAFSAGMRVYGSAATGFRSGGFNIIGSGAPPTYEPEEVTSYELGTKMNLGGRASVEAALFYSNWVDMQGPDFFTNSSGLPDQYTSNVGEARMKGIEVAVSWEVLDRLTLNLNGDVTDTEVTKIGLVPRPPLFVGDPIDMVPEYSFSVGADYSFDWSAAMPGYFRAQYSEQGRSTQTSRNIDSPVRQDSTPVLHFLNASIGAEWLGWEFELFGRNLLDEDGALRAGSGLTAQARPISVGLKFAKSF